MERSDLEPTSKAQYFGKLVNTIQERVFLTDSLIVRFQELAGSFLLPAPPAKMWQQFLGHIASPRIVCSQGTSQDVLSLVAAEDVLVDSF